ncbi:MULTISPECIES: hypothetical protein [Methylobacteriaceae]|uniref:hypothetical protein n=1 Tax=Methylobacteriaceae TaxID=119045 RepID=UPI00074F9503|nr:MULTISPECIES: hypothetical protein [Methylobacteriaceae]AMB47111.1 hypothetical protein Y590_19400 [Methylobacterium sp. AMS5]TFZ56842.1 hypothetical protein E4V01_17320 [Methylorubrum sp. Q1]
MKPFITSQPESERTRLDSSFDPVLSGVARGLARLFPPIENVRPPRSGSNIPSTSGTDGTAGGRRGHV